MQNCQFEGNLGADPELSYPGSGQRACCRFSLAVNERWNDRQTGQLQTRTTWIRCAIWGAQAENFAKYTRKGSHVMIWQSRFRTNEYPDPNHPGETRRSFEFEVQVYRFLDRRPSGDGAAPSQQPQQAAQQPQQETATTEDFDDDIPF